MSLGLPKNVGPICFFFVCSNICNSILSFPCLKETQHWTLKGFGLNVCEKPIIKRKRFMLATKIGSLPGSKIGKVRQRELLGNTQLTGLYEYIFGVRFHASLILDPVSWGSQQQSIIIKTSRCPYGAFGRHFSSTIGITVVPQCHNAS